VNVYELASDLKISDPSAVILDPQDKIFLELLHMSCLMLALSCE
jgi:hypothetical protein